MAKDIRVVLRLDSSDFNRGISSAQDSVRGLSSDITGIASALGLALGTSELIDYVAEWQNLQNRIRATFETTNEQVVAFGNIKKIAEETRSGLADVADLYTKLKIGGDSLKLTQGEISQVTETFTKALKASGAGAAQTSAAILQFGQAMASGKLQGDEFRSLMENSPVFMRALSEALGRPIGDLKKLASEGAITSEVILAATLEMADGIDAKFAETIPTITDSFTQMQNTIMETFGRMEESTGTLNKIFTFVGNNIITILKVIGTLMLITFGASLIRSIGIIAVAFGGLIKTFQTLRAVIMGAAAAQAFMTGMTGVGLVAVAASLATVTAAYYAMDKLFDEGDAKIQENNANYEALTKTIEENAETSRQSAAEALKAGQARAQAEKDATKAARESAAEARRLARERQRDLERARDQLITIKEQTQSLEDQFTLDNRRLFLSEKESDLQQKLLDLQKERRRQIAEISKLELLTAAERATQEAKVNEEFDARSNSLTSMARAMENNARTMSTMDQANAIGRTTEAFKTSLETRLALLTTFNEFERRGIQETADVRAKYAEEAGRIQSDWQSRLQILQYTADEQTLAREQARVDEQIRIINLLRDAELKSIDERLTAERTFSEEQMTFAKGWAQAYGEYFENLRVTVNDQASYAKRIFSTITDGFTNSIMKFVETGKLSFKDLFKSLMMEIIKMQVNKLFLSIFGKGGPMGSLFAGMFANGGMIPGGKFGIAGERGPEIVTGPARVVSTKDTAAILGGGGSAPSITQVTYNINAVDSMSFKQMLARDPEFLFNATRVGARRVPR